MPPTKQSDRSLSTIPMEVDDSVIASPLARPRRVTAQYHHQRNSTSVRHVHQTTDMEPEPTSGKKRGTCREDSVERSAPRRSKKQRMVSPDVAVNGNASSPGPEAPVTTLAATTPAASLRATVAVAPRYRTRSRTRYEATTLGAIVAPVASTSIGAEVTSNVAVVKRERTQAEAVAIYASAAAAASLVHDDSNADQSDYDDEVQVVAPPERPAPIVIDLEAEEKRFWARFQAIVAMFLLMCGVAGSVTAHVAR